MNEIEMTLIKASVLIENGWTQRAQARDIKGRHILPGDEKATHFSAVGALAKAWNPDTCSFVDVIRLIAKYAREDLKNNNELEPLHEKYDLNVVIDWNEKERMTHDQVLKIFNRAICHAASKEYH